MKTESRLCAAGVVLLLTTACLRADHIRDLQEAAIRDGRSEAAHWGHDPGNYMHWGSHTNRLIPVYTFGTRGAGAGIELDGYTGENSPYRSEERVRQIYGRVPTNTVNPDAEYFDQTNIAEIQKAGLAAGKKHIFLVIFDGMDWQTTWAAAIHQTGRVAYTEGRGTGLHFQDYTAGDTTQYGYMVAASHNNGTKVDVNEQRVLNPGGTQPGGYNAEKAGPNPWTPGNDPFYPIGKAEQGLGEHAYPDSAPTAAAMTTGVKSYNGSINVDPAGAQLTTIAHVAQDQGYAIGVVTSVPISHATPAAAYAHNVDRDDYQDLTRDLLGLKSVAHPEEPLPGVDVLIGAGHGAVQPAAAGQGTNFVPGNPYLTEDDLKAVDVANGGPYVVATPVEGHNGADLLHAAADRATSDGNRLFGFFGVGGYRHLPFQTADGDYNPPPGRSKKAEVYSQADTQQNPTLADMTAAALKVLSRDEEGFWLMVESGDVDWANHDNNLDNSIGAVKSGDAAIKVITDWVEQHSNWDESLLIVTADHGHYLVITQPGAIAGSR